MCRLLAGVVSPEAEAEKVLDRPDELKEGCFRLSNGSNATVSPSLELDRHKPKY